MAKEYVLVIGGMNLDIAGISGPNYRAKDSNIGDIQLSVGGVGQNIAHNLVNLEIPTQLMTVYGADYFGNILVQECKKNQISLEFSACIPQQNSSTYMYVTDEAGDMVTAINDMKILETITPEFLNERSHIINQSKFCIVDGNLPATTLKWLADHCQVPLFADPVSMAKVRKFIPILKQLDTFKPNELEAGLLTGITVNDVNSAKQAASKLVDMGVKHVFLSIGKQGMICANNQQVIHIPIIPSKLISVNGAGDCSMAAIIWARFFYNDVLPLNELGILAQAASSITVESADSVTNQLTIRNLVKRAQTILISN